MLPHGALINTGRSKSVGHTLFLRNLEYKERWNCHAKNIDLICDDRIWMIK